MKSFGVMVMTLSLLLVLSSAAGAVEDSEPNLSEQELHDIIMDFYPDDEEVDIEHKHYMESNELWELHLSDGEDMRVNAIVSDESEEIDHLNINRDVDVEDEIKYVTKEKAKESAEDFLTEAHPEKFEKMELEADYATRQGNVSSYQAQPDHEFYLREYVGDYATDNHIEIRVCSQTGEVNRYINNFDPELEVSEPDDIISEQDAVDKYIDAGASLQFQRDPLDTDKLKLVYTPVLTYPLYLEAETGKYIDDQGEEIEKEKLVKEYRDELDRDAGALEMEKLDEPLEQEDAEEIALEFLQDLGVEGEVESVHDRSGSHVSSYESWNVRVAERDEESEDEENEDEELLREFNINVEKNRGYVSSIRVQTREKEEGVKLPDTELPELVDDVEEDESSDESVELIEQVVNYFESELLESTSANVEPGKFDRSNRSVFSFRIPFEAYGVEVQASMINLEIDAETGELMNFHVNNPVYQDDIEEPNELYSQEEAIEEFLQETEVTPEFKDEQLIYNFDNQTYSGINAESGEPQLTGRGHYVDYPEEIDDSDNKELLEFMSLMGILLPENGAVTGEQELTRTEMAKLIDSLLGGSRYYHPHEEEYQVPDDVDSDSPDASSIYELFDRELIPDSVLVGDDQEKFGPDKSITRKDLVQIAVRTMGYEQVAEIPGEIQLETQINDIDQVDDQAVNYIKLAVGLELLPLQNGNFLPEEPVTVDEAAQMYERMVEIGRLIE